MVIKNKKGWIKIVEVFVAILIITGVVVLIVEKKNPNQEEIKTKMHYDLISLLREIQMNSTMRDRILDATLPVEWENFNSSGLEIVTNKILEKSPRNFECKAKICPINENCIIQDYENRETYSETAFISADSDNYSPRQLKIFCWEKK
jgi:hypothetical protein